MYHHVDYCRIKTFLKACLIFSSLLFTSKIFAGAAEQWSGTPRQMTIADQGMRTRNGIGVENVRAANGMVNADITQRVTVDGSNATINTKVSIPANDDTFKRKAASSAGKLLRGGVAGAAAAVAMGVVLDGAGWIIDEGGKVNKKDVGGTFRRSTSYSGCSMASSYSSYGAITAAYAACGYPVRNCTSNLNPYGWTVYTCGLTEFINYATPTQITEPVPQSQVEDAFYNWFKNNPGSVTDPVTTYIYSPKDSQGNALPKSPPGQDPSFGPNEITDEMMDNYMEHRDANLQNPYTTSIQDSAQTDTTQNPGGTKTSTTTNPDGSTTTTRTETKTDPDTGEITTTVT